MNYNGGNVNRVNHYDPKTFSRHALPTRVVVREKPMLQSRKERLIEWLRPSYRYGESLVDGLQMAKGASLIILPLFMILIWKAMQKSAPAAIEAKTYGMQHRPLIEEKESGAQAVDYFTVIDQFQERRERALAKKQQQASQ